MKVRSAAAKDYLLRHGWEPLDTEDTNVKMFAGPRADSGRRITQPLPLLEHTDDYVDSIIRLITNLAIIEDRTAVEVLDEMLSVTMPANGQPATDKWAAPIA